MAEAAGLTASVTFERCISFLIVGILIRTDYFVDRLSRVQSSVLQGFYHFTIQLLAKWVLFTMNRIYHDLSNKAREIFSPTHYLDKGSRTRTTYHCTSFKGLQDRRRTNSSQFALRVPNNHMETPSRHARVNINYKPLSHAMLTL